MTAMQRLRIRLLDLGQAPLMLKIRESLSFSVEFIRIERPTNFEISDNISVDISLQTKLCKNYRKNVSYSASSWWRGNKF